MEIGTVLVYLSLVLATASVASSLSHIYTKDRRHRNVSRFLVFLCFTTTTATFFLLVYYFLEPNLGIHYVHGHTSTAYPWYYKLTGLWAGEEGTIVLWVWLISLSIIIEEAIQGWRAKKAGVDDKAVLLYDWIRAISMIILIAFLVLLINTDVFKATTTFDLVSFPGGKGINRLLLTPLMIAHPPVEFAAYAFMTLPLASALAYLITGDKKWTDSSLQWSRLSWLFLSLGIGIGALWAYTVLGWGLYWGWDPVEVANLIPWIALTGFVHTQSYFRKRKQYNFLAPLLAVVTFVLIIFATFETRSGFVASPLHAFTGLGSDIPDPGDRLVAILEGNLGAGFFMMMMLAVLLVAGILFMWMFHNIRKREGSLKGAAGVFPSLYMISLAVLMLFAILDVASFTSLGLRVSDLVGFGNKGIGLTILALLIIGIPILWIIYTSQEREEDNEPLTLSSVINDKTTMLVSVSIFTIWFVTTLLLMILGSEGLQPEVFESRLPLIVIPLMITLTVCLAWRYLGRQNSVYLIVALIIATLLAYYAVFSGNLFGAYIVVLIGALCAAIYRIFMMATGSTRKTGKKSLQIAGLFLVIAGIIGMLFWSSLTRIIGLSPPVKPDLLIAALAFLASAGAMISGLFCLRGRSPLICIIGSFLGILSLGYFFAGSVLSIIALLLILTSLPAFSKARLNVQSVRSVLGGISPQLIHLGIVLLLIGYAGSTYLMVEKDFDAYSEPLLAGSSDDFQGYELRLVDSRGTDGDGDGRYEDLTAIVEISRDGSVIGEATFHLWWMIPANPNDAHYMLDVYVENTYLEDIYFIPRAFYTVVDGWIWAHENTGNMFTSDTVGGVSFEVKTLPLMSALWGGLWMGSFGIFLLVFVDYLPVQRRPAKKEIKAKAKEEVVEEAKAEEVKVEEGVEVAEKDYEKLLEEELMKLEEEG
ncbi:MAG: cytochrome c biogenesis protein CcsA [Thermoplasmata archaeon]|nr:cytochrome c biogenesis protein CcsA [Thermoplasmata archaeon]